MCKRKWAWSKLDGIKSKQHPSAKRGEEVHKVLEDWLDKGIPIDTTTAIGKIASKGLQFLPLPGVGEVERWIELTVNGIMYHGKIDLRFAENGRRVVLDHKTTTDLKWAKSEDDLRKDEQGVIYAAHEMVEHDVQEVELRWVYYVTQEGKEKAKKVSLIVTREDVEPEFDKIEATAKEMEAIVEQNLKAKDLEPTVTACDAYGGCSYVDNCNLSSKERMKAIMAQQSLAEKLKAKQSGAAAPTNGTTGPAAPAPEALAAPAAAPAAPKVPKVNKLQKIAAASKKDPPAINPPESTEEVAPVVAPKAAVADLGERDLCALHLMSASIMRGEPYDDELARAKHAYSRADALIRAR